MKSFIISVIALLPLVAPAQQAPELKLLNEGIALHDAQNYEGAISKYREAILVNPKYPSTYYEMAFSYSMIDKPDSTLKYAEKILQMNVNVENATLLKKWAISAKLIFEGVALHDQGKYLEAIAKYKESMKLSPIHNAYYETAFTYYTMKSYDSAIRYADICISKNAETAPDAKDLKHRAIKSNGDLLTNDGIQFQEKGLLMEAVKKYRDALVFLDAHDETHLKPSVISYLSKPARLVAFADQILKGGPIQEPDVIALKGFLQGRSVLAGEKAEQTFINGVTRFPTSTNLRYEQGVYYIRSLNIPKAEDVFIKLLPTLSSSADFHFAYSGVMSVTSYYPSFYFLLLENNSDRSSTLLQSMDPLHALFPISGSSPTAADFKKGIDSFFLQWNPGIEKEFANKQKSDNATGTQLEPLYKTYVKFFTDLDKAGHREAFTCHVLKTLGDAETEKWINSHTDAMQKFYQWLKSTGREEFKKM